MIDQIGAVMPERFDVVVIGMGPGGEVAASRLLAGGKRVAVVERELIGGECGYWACIPSKTLLRPVEARAEASRAAGVGRPDLDWAAVREYRDVMIRHLDDSAQVEGYERQGATVVKAEARITGPGRVEAGGRLLQAGHIVLATGSTVFRPPIEGLDEVPVWTNREATTLTELPGEAVLLGGSAVAVELGQFMARMGTRVTLVQRAGRLLSREDPRVGELARQALEADGVRVLTGRQVRRAHAEKDTAVLELDDGGSVAADVVVLGTGRRPRTDGLGLETIGIRPDGAAPVVDEHCRLADGVWAVGDLTGVAMFTHIAKYQARVVADTILGRPRRADYRGIPRVVFCDPEIATVGLTLAQAREQGIDTATAEIDLPEQLARPWTYETDPRGTLGLLADRRRGVLIGAWAIAPNAGEWIHQAALAIRAEIPISTLLDTVAQFPTYTEGYLIALEQLSEGEPMSDLLR